MEKYAQILSFEEFDLIHDSLGKIVCTSGGFDPLHPGHATCIVESKQYGDTLVVVVNGDGFLRRKKGKAFMDLQTRCNLVACLRGVDYVIPFEIEDDPTVTQALRRIRPHVFTKGGDRVDNTNIPEWQVCQELGIELVSQVGKPKLWSSSDFLKDWGEFWHTRVNSQSSHAGKVDYETSYPLPTENFEPDRQQRQRRKSIPRPAPGLSGADIRVARER